MAERDLGTGSGAGLAPDRQLPSAVNNMSNLEEFNRRYQALMDHYGVKPQHANAASQAAAPSLPQY